MKKILAFVVLFAIYHLSANAEEDLGFKPFHPTDALLIGGNGPFNPGAENQVEAKSEDKQDFKPFHPTDALLIGGNGPFNPGAAYEKPEE